MYPVFFSSIAELIQKCHLVNPFVEYSYLPPANEGVSVILISSNGFIKNNPRNLIPKIEQVICEVPIGQSGDLYMLLLKSHGQSHGNVLVHHPT